MTERIRFITDTTCDIPDAWLREYPIHVVPCYVNYGGESYADDHVQLIRSEFYDKLLSIQPYPTTAAMSPGDAEQIMRAALNEADHLIVVTVSSKLSAVYNAMRLAGDAAAPGRYTLIDSGSMTMGMGWPIIVAAQAAMRGEPVARVVDVLERAKRAVRVYCGLETLEYVRRSGRVSWARASIGALLQIKPIILFQDGEAKSIGRVRTFRRVIDELVRLTEAQTPLDRLAVLHANNPSGAAEVYERLKHIRPATTEIPVVNVTPVIGLNIGLGALGVATLNESWRT
ncbi:MAG: DegV family protein [Blastochloris sp.]|nr:DegV family protein [Blastochloris sp.]